MDGLAPALVLVPGVGPVVVDKRHRLRVDRHGTDVPEQHHDRGEHEDPSSDDRGAWSHSAQGTGAL